MSTSNTSSLSWSGSSAFPVCGSNPRPTNAPVYLQYSGSALWIQEHTRETITDVVLIFMTIVSIVLKVSKKVTFLTRKKVKILYGV